MKAIAILLLAGTPMLAADAASILRDARKALGTPHSIRYSGSGMNAFFGQALTAGKPWPRRELESFTLAINYDQKSLREDLVFRNEVFGGRRQNLNVNGDRAWTVGTNGAAPQLAAADERQLWIWMTPHGFVQAGLAAPDATVRGRVVTFTAPGNHKLHGTIDPSGLVTRVETTFPNPILGAMPYVFTWSSYKDAGGIKVPMAMVQSEGGFPVNEFTVTNAEPNAAVDLPVPDNVRSAVLPPVRIESSKIADGVWFLGGGSHHSVLVEFRDYLTIIEGPQSDERSAAVIAEAKLLVPGKPIRYLVSTHHHFDHAGGLGTYATAGATIVTHGSNTSHWKKFFRNVKVQPVTDQYVISDGGQSIEIYTTDGDSHSDELLIAYLPKSKVLVEADSFSPGPAGAAAPNPIPPDALVLYDNIQRRKLDVAIIVGIHGRGPVPFSEFLTYLGKATR
jgi:glyoxylase-like metal-dependent hydrolase (beta-lactamase superfamily II)